MPLAYGIGGLINVPPGAVSGNGAPPASFRGQLGQQYFDTSTSPPTEYTYNGSTWQQGGNAQATESIAGIAKLSTNAQALAGTDDTTIMTPLKVAAVALQGVANWSTINPGIVQKAEQADAEAGTDNDLGMTPLLTFQALAGGNAPISVTTITGSGAVDIDTTGAISLDADAASNFSVAGAGIDLSLESSAGRVVINGEEAAADAVRIVSAAGGLDVDVALQMSLVSSQNAATAIVINASAGGIDITAAGAATEDIDIVNTNGSVNITAGENVADSIVITSSAGGIDIIAAGAATEDIDITNTAGSIRLTSGEVIDDSMVFASSGGIDADAAGQINIDSSQAAADAILLNASDAAGGIEIQAGTGGIFVGNQADCTTIDVGDFAPTASRTITVGGGTVVTAAVTDTIDIGPDGATTNANSIKTVNINTGGVTTGQVLTNIATGAVTSGTHTTGIATGNRAAGTMACNIMTGTGTKTLSIGNADGLTTTAILGPVNINVNQNNDIAINSGTSTGTITIGNTAAGAVVLNSGSTIAIGDASAGAITVDTAAGISLDSATASNFTVTGAGADLTLSSVLGSVLVSSTEDAALAIRLHANGGISETIQIHADQGTGVSSIGLLSDDGGITIRSTALASADAINLEAAAGGIDIDAALQINIASSQNAVDAIRIISSAGGIDIDAVGAATEDINITNTGGSVVVAATEAIADAITLSASSGGIDITSAGAGLDIDLLATGGSINVTATQAAADAIVLNASDAAGGIDITTGGGSVDISSSGFATVVAATDTEASPSATAEINANVGRATFTGFTTAAAASQVFVITNSIVTTSSCVLVTVCNEGANDAQMTITRVTRAAGSLSVTCTNNGAAALNGNLAINFWVLTA
jgi:fibronectin-binding autotransporter adhesin